MEMEQQFLVRLVNGGTRCMRFAPGNPVCCEVIKERVFELEGIPPPLQRIVTGTRELREGDLIAGDVAVLLRLRGGKGGFGSLLRGAASKAHKKTSNFDACRDMSGRRLRHVNAEKLVKVWDEEAPMRALEEIGLDYVNNLSRKRKNESDLSEELDNLRAQLEKNSANVQAAVLDGLNRDRKKKKNNSNSNELLPPPKFEGAGEVIESELLVEVQEVTVALVVPPIAEETEPEAQAIPPPKMKPPVEVQAEARAPKPTVEEPVIELDLENVASSKDLEAFGLDKLKSELQRRGLKCGGSLAERAARLFLLKSTPLEKLDKKHFAGKAK